MINRRYFLKTVSMAGLTFTGISGFSCSHAHTEEPASKEMKHFDVVVCGGGPGGVSAALAAAREGASVLIIEKYPFLGGMATAGLVNPFMRFTDSTKTIVVTKGTFTDLLNRLRNEQGLDDSGSPAFDSEKMKWILDEMCAERGITTLFHAQVIGVLKNESRIKAVRVFHKGATEEIGADLFIDATGDGDVATWFGSPYEIGRAGDHGTQPMTLFFRVSNIDTRRTPNRQQINALYDAAKERGEVNNPRENVLLFPYIHEGVWGFNTTRIVGKSAVDGWSMSEAEIEGRRQVKQMFHFLKKDVPGFENAILQSIAPQTGVRESRRILGDYLLTQEDAVEERRFDDAIAACTYPVDIHNPLGGGTVITPMKNGGYYTIPYRCITPRGCDNLLIASRCISATHEAHASMRVMPTVWSIGEAAGVAAGMCVAQKIDTRRLNIKTLQEKLKQYDCFPGI